jgi:ribosomal RNA assembly protein
MDDISEFALLYPSYREKYLTDHWRIVREKCGENGVDARIETSDGVLLVRTTRSTWDPAAILLARDMIRLLARSVPVEQAVRVFEDGIGSIVLVLGREVASAIGGA